MKTPKIIEELRHAKSSNKSPQSRLARKSARNVRQKERKFRLERVSLKQFQSIPGKESTKESQTE
jgi:hypothetical protein